MLPNRLGIGIRDPPAHGNRSGPVLFGRAVRGPAEGAPTPVRDVGSAGAVGVRDTRMTAIAANRIAPALREPAYRLCFVVLHSHAVLTHLTPKPWSSVQVVQRTTA